MKKLIIFLLKLNLKNLLALVCRNLKYVVVFSVIVLTLKKTIIFCFRFYIDTFIYV